MNLLVLVGSTRPGSFNAQLADLAVADLPAGVTVTRFDRLHQLPFYEEHTDAPIAGKPVAVLAATASPGGAGGARAGAVECLTRALAKPFADTIGVGSAHQSLVGGRLTDEGLTAAIHALVARLVRVPVAA